MWTIARIPNHAVTMASRVLICGHSYINKLRVFTHVAQRCDENFGLQQIEATWLGIPGMNIRQLKANIPLIAEENPHIVFIQCAGNDLDSKKCPHIIIDELVAVIKTIIKSGVELVIVDMAIRRTKPKYISPEQYQHNVDLFNATMAEILVNPEEGKNYGVPFI